MAKFVQIQSDVTIRVTTGLQNKDVTNPDAHIPDRLKVNPEWPKHQVLIRKGAHRYPAEIVEWMSVKALAADKILTIGSIEEVDEDKLNELEQKDLNIVSEAKKEFKMPDVKCGNKNKTLSADEKQSSKKTLTLSDLVGKGE